MISDRKNSNEMSLLDEIEQEGEDKPVKRISSINADLELSRRSQSKNSIIKRLSMRMEPHPTQCLICQDEMPQEYFTTAEEPSDRLDCWREHMICKDCQLSYIQNKVQECKVQNIVCPKSSTALDKCPNTYTDD